MILLDTHALIWWIEGSGRLSELAAKAIKDAKIREYAQRHGDVEVIW